MEASGRSGGLLTLYDWFKLQQFSTLKYVYRSQYFFHLCSSTPQNLLTKFII